MNSKQKETNEEKTPQTNRLKKQIDGHQRGREVGSGTKCKGGQMYGKAWKLDFGW